MSRISPQAWVSVDKIRKKKKSKQQVKLSHYIECECIPFHTDDCDFCKKRKDARRSK